MAFVLDKKNCFIVAEHMYYHIPAYNQEVHSNLQITIHLNVGTRGGVCRQIWEPISITHTLLPSLFSSYRLFNRSVFLLFCLTLIFFFRYFFFLLFYRMGKGKEGGSSKDPCNDGALFIIHENEGYVVFFRSIFFFFRENCTRTSHQDFYFRNVSFLFR